MIADTRDIAGHGAGVYYTVGFATIAIEGIGTGTIDFISSSVFCNQNGPSAGLSNFFDWYDVLSVHSDELADYALDGPIGPLVDFDPYHNVEDMPTSIGSVTFDAVSVMSFQAVIVPAPGTMVGIMCLAAFGGRRRARVRDGGE
jgi:hypothetical protein